MFSPNRIVFQTVGDRRGPHLAGFLTGTLIQILEIQDTSNLREKFKYIDICQLVSFPHSFKKCSWDVGNACLQECHVAGVLIPLRPRLTRPPNLKFLVHLAKQLTFLHVGTTLLPLQCKTVKSLTTDDRQVNLETGSWMIIQTISEGAQLLHVMK